jgi:hypothetical protein
MAPSKTNQKQAVVSIPMNSLICITLVICTSLKVKCENPTISGKQIVINPSIDQSHMIVTRIVGLQMRKNQKDHTNMCTSILQISLSCLKEGKLHEGCVSGLQGVSCAENTACGYHRQAQVNLFTKQMLNPFMISIFWLQKSQNKSFPCEKSVFTLRDCVLNSEIFFNP